MIGVINIDLTGEWLAVSLAILVILVGVVAIMLIRVLNTEGSVEVKGVKINGISRGKKNKSINKYCLDTFCIRDKFSSIVLMSSTFGSHISLNKHKVIERQMDYIEQTLEYMREELCKCYLGKFPLSGDSLKLFLSGLSSSFELYIPRYLKMRMKENNLAKLLELDPTAWENYKKDKISQILQKLDRIMYMSGFNMIVSTCDKDASVLEKFSEMFDECLKISLSFKEELDKEKQEFDGFFKEMCGDQQVDLLNRIIVKE